MPASRRFTVEEDDFIRAHYRAMSYRDIAERLDRTTVSIAHRVGDLGLKKVHLRRWTAEEDEIIRHRGERMLADVARQLGRGRSEVSNRARVLGTGSWRNGRSYKISNTGHVVRGYIRKNGKAVRHMEHRAVMEEHLGRDLRDGEVVHHVNGDKRDNRIDNLHLCRDFADHQRVHRSLERLLPDLLERGIVRFERDRGVYELCEIGNCKPVWTDGVGSAVD